MERPLIIASEQTSNYVDKEKLDVENAVVESVWCYACAACAASACGAPLAALAAGAYAGE